MVIGVTVVTVVTRLLKDTMSYVFVLIEYYNYWLQWLQGYSYIFQGFRCNRPRLQGYTHKKAIPAKCKAILDNDCERVYLQSVRQYLQSVRQYLQSVRQYSITTVKEHKKIIDSL